MKRKHLFSLITITGLLLSLTTTTFAYYSYEENVSPPAENVSQIIGDGNTVVFIDVPANHWAKEQIDYFAQQGIVSGYPDGSFKPEAGVKRSEFCKLLVSMFNPPLEIPSTPTFSDVPANNWAYAYVEACSDFLTGYNNPFGGMPSFHPEENAKREDIAVALVRMMGLTDKDANNPDFAAYNFKDGGSISPDIVAYVSIACERGLISGYPDGSFGPSRGITRAETVALLNRATKQAVTNINSELEMQANVVYSSDGQTAAVYIVAEEGTTVTVNGEAVMMSNNSYDQYEGCFIYTFEQEGSKDFTVEGKRGGKTKRINVTAKYEIGVPTLTIKQQSQSVTEKEFTLSGTATDDNSSVSITVNGKSVNIGGYYNNYNDEAWSADYILDEGENVFTVVATNENGKQTTKSITVTYSVDAPKLTVKQNNQTVTDKNFTLSGTATDDNYSVTVTVNGKNVDLGGYYNNYNDEAWSADYILDEGENVFTVVATNENGKQTTKSITVTYSVGAPKLTVKQNNQTVTDKNFTLSGTATDDNYSVTVTVNGKNVDLGGYYNNYNNEAWSADYILDEGENEFTIVATNENGKQTTKSITVTYSVGAPKLTVKQNNQTVTDKNFTLSGTATDDNYSVTVTVNGKNVDLGGYYNNYNDEAWSADYVLDEGENEFTIVATNENGKQTTKTVTITLEVGKPEIVFINCPESTTKNRITVKGRIKGNNEGAMLFIDDEEVYVNYNGEFSETLDLEEGDNTFDFRAVNDYAKEVTVTKIITYTPKAESNTDEITEE